MIKLLDILENKILVPRRPREERAKNYLIATQKKVQQYVKDGSKGDLELSGTPIASLPSGLSVGGNLTLFDTPLSKSHTEEQIKQMAPGVKGDIYI